MSSDRQSFMANIKSRLYSKMMQFCEKNQMYKSTFVHHAIISKLIFDEDFQKEVLSEIEMQHQDLYYFEVQNAFNELNKFKSEYEKCQEMIVNYFSKGIPAKTKTTTLFRGPQVRHKRPERIENHFKAADWILISPEGKRYEIHNLRHFIRNQPDLFGIDGSESEVMRIYSGIHSVKEHLKKGKIKPYFGWTVEIPENERI